MNHDFPEDFMRTLGVLLETCAENNTDTIEVHFDINGRSLSVEMIFCIDEDCDHHE